MLTELSCTEPGGPPGWQCSAVTAETVTHLNGREGKGDSVVTSTETRSSPDASQTAPRSQGFVMTEKRGCIKATQAQTPCWVLDNQPQAPVPVSEGRGLLQPGVRTPGQNPVNTSSRPTGLHRGKPRDHSGGCRPFLLASQSTATFKSFDELLGSSDNALLLLGRPLVMTRGRRGLREPNHTRGVNERRPGWGGHPSCDHIPCTKRTLMAAVKGACQLKRGETKQATDCEGPNKVANGPPALQNGVRPRGSPRVIHRSWRGQGQDFEAAS